MNSTTCKAVSGASLASRPSGATASSTSRPSATSTTPPATIDIGGHRLERTKKYRDIEHDGRVAVVIDDIAPPWQPRGVEIRGHAEPLSSPEPLIRVDPKRIVSWGIESRAIGVRHARAVKGIVP